MKKCLQFAVGTWFIAGAFLQAQANFSAIYAFGDGVCTTTNNSSTGPLYYGKRYSNGRVWIEVLAQRLGIAYDANKNWSYYGNFSDNTVVNVSQFIAPADATNDLFIVWVCDADFVGDLGETSWGPPYTGASLTPWNNAINQSISNHFNIITNLYFKGARALVMPNAVDLGKIPQYNGLDASDRSFIRGRVSYFNTNFAATLRQAEAVCPGLQIQAVDFFSIFDNVISNAAYYGLTNAVDFYGRSIDAIDGLPDVATNGPGTNYVFWDATDPTAQLHAVMADIVEQMLLPVRIGKVTALAGSNRLDVVNYPAGLNGFVKMAASLMPTNWTAVASLSSTNTTQSVFVPAAGPWQCYRLCFPFAWSWP